MTPQERTARRAEIEYVRYTLACIREELEEQRTLRRLGADPTLDADELRLLLTRRAAGRRLLRRLEAELRPRPVVVHVLMRGAGPALASGNG